MGQFLYCIKMFWIAKLYIKSLLQRRFEARRWKQFGAECFFCIVAPEFGSPKVEAVTDDWQTAKNEVQ